MNDWPYCVGLGGLKKYFLSNLTFTGIPELVVIYLSANLVFNCFGTKKSSPKSIFAFHFFKVGFPVIAFTAKSLPRSNYKITGLLLTSS